MVLSSTPSARYESIRARTDSEISALERRLPWAFVGRGLGAFGALGLGVYGLLQANRWALAASFAAFVAFLIVAFVHERWERERRRLQMRKRHALRSLAAIERRWADLPGNDPPIPETRQAVAKDLDLFGARSLFRLLNTTATPFGRDTLRDWLLEPVEPTVIRQRQEAVRTLAAMPEFGEELRLRGEAIGKLRHDGGLDALMQWAEGKGGVGSWSALIAAARLLAVTMLLMIVGLALGLIDKEIGGYSILALLLINFLVTLTFAGRVHDLFNSVAARQTEAQAYHRWFAWAADAPGEVLLLRRIREQLAAGDGAALTAVRTLGRIMFGANLRRAGLFGLFYIPLQFGLLWDFHWLAILESWRRRHGSEVRGWFEAIGRLEALAALGKLAHDEPAWCFPEIVADRDEPAMIKAQGLGHPLLGAQRVLNDVDVGPPGTVLLVTGSNMSGKSTLLRSIGLAIVLARAGGPVCASVMRSPALEIETSMRVHDSLADGVSFYMAELQRLKEIVDRARRGSSAPPPQLPVCFLLDEILQGTNSRERHVAVTKVLSHLIECGAIGAVSSHDLELADAPGIQGRAVCVHFRESFEPDLKRGDGRSRMVFDYVMRPGVSTTTNALKLLEIVGLGDGS